jgi:hypothetical protein
MSLCKVLFDECLQVALPHGLRLRSPQTSILQVGEPGTPRKGTDDPELLTWCENDRRLFVSGDRATLLPFISAHHKAGRHTFGVFVLRPGKKFSDILDDLQLIVEASEAEEWIDHFDYLPKYLSV